MKQYRRHQSYLARRIEKRGRRKFFLTLLVTGIFIYFFLSWLLPNIIGGMTVLNKYKGVTKVETPISERNTLTPPVFSIPYIATSSAEIKIKGYSTPLSKVEIYLDDSLTTTINVQDDGSFLSDPVPLSLGSNSIYGKTVDGKGNKSLPSKTISITFANDKPNLDISDPQDNQTVKDKKITVSGTTDAGKDIEVSIGGVRVIVSVAGSFSREVELSEGENVIKITAKNNVGNTTELERKVTYQP